MKELEEDRKRKAEMEAAAEKAKEEIERLASEVLLESPKSPDVEVKVDLVDGPPVEENIGKVDLSVVECAVNLEDMFERMEAEEKERPKSDEQLEQKKRISDYHTILEQTRMAVDICDHRLREDSDLRLDDFELDVDDNVKVGPYVMMESSDEKKCYLWIRQCKD